MCENSLAVLLGSYIPKIISIRYNPFPTLKVLMQTVCLKTAIPMRKDTRFLLAVRKLLYQNSTIAMLYTIIQ